MVFVHRRCVTETIPPQDLQEIQDENASVYFNALLKAYNCSRLNTKLYDKGVTSQDSYDVSGVVWDYPCTHGVSPFNTPEKIVCFQFAMNVMSGRIDLSIQPNIVPCPTKTTNFLLNTTTINLYFK